MMNQDNDQENNTDASVDIPRRKRGRPRKFPKYDFNQYFNRGENSQTPMNQNSSFAEHTRIPPGFEGVNRNQPPQGIPPGFEGVNRNQPRQANPPGFEGVNRNQPRQGNPINDANNEMVGQPVYGVVEMAFDAGYLLTVRVGDSDTTLRGVVFKPGHYVPVSAENDVAPNVQMISRNEIPFPRQRNEPHVNSHRNGALRAFNEPAVANQAPRARASNLGDPKSRNVLVAKQSVNPLLSRGNVVPVVLQPASLQNGESVANRPSSVASEPAQSAASKGKQVSVAAHTSNVRTPTNQMPTVGNRIFPTQSEGSDHAMPKGAQSAKVSYNQPNAEVLQEAEATSMTGRPFEKLLTDFMKSVQVPPQPIDVEGGNLSNDDSEDTLEDQPLSPEPLQAVQPAHSSFLKPLEKFRTGKMTQLLQAVQENMREPQASRSEEPAIGSGETQTGGVKEEMRDSNKH